MYLFLLFFVVVVVMVVVVLSLLLLCRCPGIMHVWLLSVVICMCGCRHVHVWPASSRVQLFASFFWLYFCMWSCCACGSLVLVWLLPFACVVVVICMCGCCHLVVWWRASCILLDFCMSSCSECGGLVHVWFACVVVVICMRGCWPVAFCCILFNFCTWMDVEGLGVSTICEIEKVDPDAMLTIQTPLVRWNTRSPF